MATMKPGARSISASRGDDGHRTYKFKVLVKATTSESLTDVMNASGLPAVGDLLGSDGSAFLHPEMDIKIHEEKEGEPAIWYAVELNYSTKPLARCFTTQITTPIAEPPKISGSFTKYTKEATVDRNNQAITNSSLEQIRGQPVERDFNRPSVVIQMNVGTLPLATFAQVIDTVNGATMWGLPKRCVKLSNVKYEKKIYNLCTFYYDITYEFDIDYNTFDQDILDEGTRVLGPGGTVSNPQHFVPYKDKAGENARTILDGAGNAWNGTGSPGSIHVEFYAESNFVSVLNVPSSL